MNRLPRRRSSAGCRRVRTGVALALLAAGVPAAGQDAATEAPAPAEAAAPAAPQAIPLSQIEPSAEKVEQSLREITEHTRPDAGVVAIAEALPEKTQRLRGDSKALPALIAERSE